MRGALAQHACELLRVEWVAAGILEQACLYVGVDR